jgi:hypothetical protein
LRDDINTTIGFDSLAEASNTPAKSLTRMFGPKGKPTAANLFAVINALQERTGVRLKVRAVCRIRLRFPCLATVVWRASQSRVPLIFSLRPA